MDPEEGIPVALVVSKSLRKWLLRRAGLVGLAGLIMIPLDFWAIHTFKFPSRPGGGDNLVMVFLLLAPLGLISLAGLMFFAWIRAAFLAKIYRKAAEDGRDFAQELGFMDRD